MHKNNLGRINLSDQECVVKRDKTYVFDRTAMTKSFVATAMKLPSHPRSVQNIYKKNILEK